MSNLKINQINEWNIINKNIPFQNAITQNDINKLCKNWNTISLQNFNFNHVIDKEPKITNQKNSGRCWMFAGLNVLRINFIKKFNLQKDFEFSQTHLFFYDKLERANTFLNTIITNINKPIDDRYMRHILDDPLGDGGYWHTFANLVHKYGLVPKSVYPETHHSSNSSRMNFILAFQLRQFAKELREQHQKNNYNSQNKLLELKNSFLKEYHRLLSLFLGTPTTYFDWIYTDKDDKYNIKNNLTPNEFYKMADWDINNFITLTHDPRNKENTKMKMDFIGNIHGTSNIIYYNTSIQELEKWTKISIDNGIPVWFGCDVGKWLDKDKDIMDLDIVNYDNLLQIEFNLSKKERMEYGISCPTHAMSFVGYESNDENNGAYEIYKWKVENSWDSKGENSGYYVMSNKWFQEYVYEVVIPKWIIDENTIKKINDCNDIIQLPPWDVMNKYSL